MTENELAEVLEKLWDSMEQEDQRKPGQFTTSEYARLVGISSTAARQRLEKMECQGLLKRVKFDKLNGWGEKVTGVKGWEKK